MENSIQQILPNFNYPLFYIPVESSSQWGQEKLVLTRRHAHPNLKDSKLDEFGSDIRMLNQELLLPPLDYCEGYISHKVLVAATQGIDYLLSVFEEKPLGFNFHTSIRTQQVVVSRVIKRDDYYEVDYNDTFNFPLLDLRYLCLDVAYDHDKRQRGMTLYHKRISLM